MGAFDTDPELVAAARAGSDGAFARLVARHQGAVRGFLRRVLGGHGHGTPVRPESVDRMRSLLDELTSGTDGGRR